MFDIGMLEIMIILVIALLVIGPERMPEVARKIGQFMGKTKRFVHSVRENSELNDTVRELQSSMNLEQERKELEDISRSMHTDFSEIEKDLRENEGITRPFGELDEVSPSQFNRAPAQPKPPKTPDSETSESSDTTGSEAPPTTADATDSTPAKPEPSSDSETTEKRTTP
ncbi:MAG: Sec-independent protein translocase protein TatB [Hydrogenovibrio sp.]|uniref:Sec-independent protein translocase protein TatB n=1 Tax=Hydrogenovibrio sp. TaxID=2065821 RepID=UPI00287002E5|nr:Sec-independent protein translocase protein TatB [Hydrogenovibrio sp.]MDR9498910.1 Sec-independent protein translocase protein TatB [Hydrogenovibrio sp.]